MELFHPPIVFHDDSQSATSPGIFQILKKESMDRDIQKYNENPSLRAANSLMTKCLPMRKPCRSTNIGTDMIVSSRRLRSTSKHRRFLYCLQSHLGNFAHNIGQWIVLNHAIVYNETVRGGIHGYILLTIEF